MKYILIAVVSQDGYIARYSGDLPTTWTSIEEKKRFKEAKRIEKERIKNEKKKLKQAKREEKRKLKEEKKKKKKLKKSYKKNEKNLKVENRNIIKNNKFDSIKKLILNENSSKDFPDINNVN